VKYRHHVEALMTFMTDDCVYETSAEFKVAGRRRHTG
jgi:hypothetical protein